MSPMAFAVTSSTVEHAYTQRSATCTIVTGSCSTRCRHTRALVCPANTSTATAHTGTCGRGPRPSTSTLSAAPAAASAPPSFAPFWGGSLRDTTTSTSLSLWQRTTSTPARVPAALPAHKTTCSRTGKSRSNLTSTTSSLICPCTLSRGAGAHDT